MTVKLNIKIEMFYPFYRHACLPASTSTVQAVLFALMSNVKQT